MDMCTRLAAVMHLFPPEHIMVAEYLHQQYDPQLVCRVSPSPCMCACICVYAMRTPCAT